MKLERLREIYRVAFDAANSELAEINAEFEKLRVRKVQIESLVSVLKPLIGDEDPVNVSMAENSSPEAATIAEISAESKGEPQPVPTDPFQRRIDHVLGIGAGIRDVRKYSRQF